MACLRGGRFAVSSRGIEERCDLQIAALLRATEAKLQPIRERVERGTLRGESKIGLAVGAVRDKYKMSKHIELEIGDEKFAFSRKEAQIAEETSLDGVYILRTTVDAQFSAGDVVRSYKELAKVERAFRTMKSDDLEIRPIHHRLEDRVRAHVFLCMLAYYLEWHLRKAWAPLLFADENPQVPEDPVTQATRSPQAVRHAHGKPSSAIQRTRAGPCWITWPAKCAPR